MSTSLQKYSTEVFEGRTNGKNLNGEEETEGKRQRKKCRIVLVNQREQTAREKN